jgi:hypothetical protein
MALIAEIEKPLELLILAVVVEQVQTTLLLLEMVVQAL